MADTEKVPIKERGIHNVLQKLEKSIEEGDTYSALQMFKTLYFRYSREKKWEDLKQLLVRGAKMFLQKADINSGSDLGNLLLEVFTKTAAPVDNKHVGMILDIFALYKADNHPSKRQFARGAIKWSTNKYNNDQGDIRLHTAFARSYRQAKEWSIAQKHYIRSSVAEEYAEMILEWVQADNAVKELDVYVARAVLLYLCLGHVQQGNKFFDAIKVKKPNLDSPLVNFVDLLLQAVEAEGTLPTFELLRSKYAPSIDRDPNFKSYLEHIAFVFYGVQKQGAGGLGGMLNDLMKGFLSNDQ